MYLHSIVVIPRFTRFRQFDALQHFTIGQWYRVSIKTVSPLCLVAGFSPHRIKWCLMHSVHLGICQWLNASGIYELIRYNYLSKVPDAKLSDHLHEFTRRLNLWCSFNRIRQLMARKSSQTLVFKIYV